VANVQKRQKTFSKMFSRKKAAQNFFKTFKINKGQKVFSGLRKKCFQFNNKMTACPRRLGPAPAHRRALWSGRRRAAARLPRLLPYLAARLHSPLLALREQAWM